MSHGDFFFFYNANLQSEAGGSENTSPLYKYSSLQSTNMCGKESLDKAIVERNFKNGKQLYILGIIIKEVI